MGIRIILADDHRIVREGLRALLEEHADMDVIAQAENGRKTVRLARQLAPEVVVMDLCMPDLNGVEATRQIASLAPGVKVVVLSIHSDRRFVARALSAGASGYLLKNSAPEELALAIRTVAANRTYLSPGVADVVVKDYVNHLSKAVCSALTARGREVLQLLAEGKTTKEIALCLHVSVKTIETHRRQIMLKLGIHSVAELTKYAIREGLTFLEI